MQKFTLQIAFQKPVGYQQEYRYTYSVYGQGKTSPQGSKANNIGIMMKILPVFQPGADLPIIRPQGLRFFCSKTK
jgi:hypothetical protein